MRETERQRHRQREKQAPCREPDVGLDPGTPGSRPGLKAVLNRRATRAALAESFKFNRKDFCCQEDGVNIILLILPSAYN